jgi:uracil-DNA glycosylase
VVVCLGKIAFDGFLNHQLRSGKIAARSGFEFRHGAEYVMPGGITLLASYHPSLQNTNTGKLTRAMFLDVFIRARRAAGLIQ